MPAATGRAGTLPPATCHPTSSTNSEMRLIRFVECDSLHAMIDTFIYCWIQKIDHRRCLLLLIFSLTRSTNRGLYKERNRRSFDQSSPQLSLLSHIELAMSLPCSDQGLRPKKMKYASLPEGMEAARCWCGDIAKVRESTDFSDRMGMKFFMCANHAHDPPESSQLFYRAPVRYKFHEMIYLLVLYWMY
jgi:hypothetical protein